MHAFRCVFSQAQGGATATATWDEVMSIGTDAMDHVLASGGSLGKLEHSLLRDVKVRARFGTAFSYMTHLSILERFSLQRTRKRGREKGQGKKRKKKRERRKKKEGEKKGKRRGEKEKRREKKGGKKKKKKPRSRGRTVPTGVTRAGPGMHVSGAFLKGSLHPVHNGVRIVTAQSQHSHPVHNGVRISHAQRADGDTDRPRAARRSPPYMTHPCMASHTLTCRGCRPKTRR